MPTPAEQLERLRTTDAETSHIVKPLPHLPFPPKVIARFPELEHWQKQQREMLEAWRKELVIAIFGKPG